MVITEKKKKPISELHGAAKASRHKKNVRESKELAIKLNYKSIRF